MLVVPKTEEEGIEVQKIHMKNYFKFGDGMNPQISQLSYSHIT